MKNRADLPDEFRSRQHLSPGDVAAYMADHFQALALLAEKKKKPFVMIQHHLQQH